MIPRFIIRNPTSSLLDKLLDMGFESADSAIDDALILGRHILNCPQEKLDNPLLKVFDGKYHEKDILELAQLQIRWQATAQKVELLLGDPQKGKVVVSRLGVMIDSCLLPISMFHELEQKLLAFKSPFLVTHELVIDKKRPFIIVGCATYSLDDLSKILTTFYSLS